MAENTAEEHTCQRCGYHTCDIRNFRRHLLRKNVCLPKSADVEITTLQEQFIPEKKEKTLLCNCGKAYSSRSGLFLHKRQCTQPAEPTQDVLVTNKEEPPEPVTPLVAQITQTVVTRKTKKKKKIPSGLRKTSWEKHIGKVFEAKCPCCKHNTVTSLDFHCGHIIAEANGGLMILSNLIPICARCNIGMGTQNMAEFARSSYGVNMVLK